MKLKKSRRGPSTSTLKVIAFITSRDTQDPDGVPMVSWSEYNPVPCFYLGAFSDSLDFLPDGNDSREEQEADPARWFFVFNTIPATESDILSAISQHLA